MATTNWQVTDINESQAQKATTNNTANQEIENANAAQTALTVTTADITLTDAQHNGTVYFKCTGALTANRNVLCKTRKHWFIVEHACTGGFAITFKTVSGTGVTLNPGDIRMVYCDGTNVVGPLGGRAAGAVRVSTQFDAAANTTLANITGLSIALTSGRSYWFRAVLFVAASAAGGHKYAVQSTGTVSAIIYNITAVDNTSLTDKLSSEQTSLGGSAGEQSGTSYKVVIDGQITTTALGNLTIQFAQQVASGTSSVKVGSMLQVTDDT